MSATISPEEFVRRVTESGILLGTDLSATHEWLGGEGRVSDAGALAGTLVRAGKLTPFQTDAILAGRLPELCVDDRWLGLTPKETDLQLVPKLVWIRARPAAAQPFQVSASLIAMPQAVMGHRQKGPGLGNTHSVVELNPFL
jgi:hypothetical protein